MRIQFTIVICVIAHILTLADVNPTPGVKTVACFCVVIAAWV